MMIPEEIAVKFKGASNKQKHEISVILMDNYMRLINEMVTKADYGYTMGYWKDHIPVSKEILTAKEFIKKYGAK